MASETTSPKATARRPWLRFSLRSLLTIMLLIAAFCGGWMSHQRWGQLDLERALTEAMRKAQRPGPGKAVQYVDGMEIINTTPPKEQSEGILEMIRLIERHTNK